MVITSTKSRTFQSVRILMIMSILMIIGAFMCIATVHSLEDDAPVLDVRSELFDQIYDLTYAEAFPDPNFRTHVLTLLNDMDGDGRTLNSLVTDGDQRIMEALNSLDVSGKNIGDLTGIEYFKDLEILYCSNNRLSELELTNNAALIDLYCYNNLLSELDVSNNIALSRIDCYINQLSELDVTNNTALTYLYCFSNRLSELDVRDNAALTYLYCNNNRLSELDVSNNSALTSLYCNNNQLRELNVTSNAALKQLDCGSNQLGKLDIANNIVLASLECQYNHLSELDVSNNNALTYLSCQSNQLSELDVTNNTALTALYCNNNQLSELDLSNNTALYRLDCYVNQLSGLDVTNNTALTALYCYSNKLSVLDVSNNTKLYSLYCNNNQLCELDVSKNTALQYLYCNSNQLSGLDVSNNTSLAYLYCYDNNMGEDPDIVKGWRNLGLVINSHSDINNGTFLFYNQLQPLISVLNIKGRAGETVIVPIVLEYNPGMMSLRLGIKYDNKILKLEGVTSEWSGMMYTSPVYVAENPYNALWLSETTLNNKNDGVILALEFTILSDAVDGVYQIELTCDPLNTVDENNNPIEVELINGSIEVISYRYGDVDGNGIITSFDAGLILRYTNGWDIDSFSFNPLVADVDGNGVISSYDAVLVLQYINGWFDKFPAEMAGASLAGVLSADVLTTDVSLTDVSLAGVLSADVLTSDISSTDVLTAGVSPTDFSLADASTPETSPTGAFEPSSPMFTAMSALEDSPVVTVISPSDPVKPGDTVNISLKLENNPGILGLRVGIEYDNEALQLESAASLWAGMTYTLAQNIFNNPYYAMWTSSSLLNNYDDSAILNLQFTALPGAAAGIYTIKLVYDQLNTYDKNNNPIVVDTVNGIATIQSTVAPLYYTITVSATAGGAAANGGAYLENTGVTVTAKPDEDYSFDGWYEDDLRVSDDMAYNFFASADRNLEARFIKTNTLIAVKGKILSFNPKNSATIKLIDGEDIVYTTTIPAIGGTGQVEQEFIFEDVEPGAYTLEITKPAHTKFTLKDIVVGETGLNLTEDNRSEVRLMTLRCGDVNGDGVIDDRDLTNLWLSFNYYRNTAQAANPLCDFNGDGVIDDRDLTILWTTYNYYRGEIVIE